MRSILVAFLIWMLPLCGPAHAQPQGDIMFGEVSRFTEAADALNRMGYDAGPADA